MIERTLYFGNPAYLCLRDNQLVVKKKDGEPKTVPVEDVGFIILDSPQVTISCALLSFLTKNNCAVISCDSKHLPSGLFLPLAGNSLQNERFRHQIEASLPLKKQLWQQTVQQKILNQASVLQLRRKCPVKILFSCAGNVRSGDADNREAVAAAYYWKQLFPLLESFTRDRFGVPPNNIFNYGYAILRGVVARSLVASGLLPTFGIHHSNRYNAYCLADDIMEPYRPIVDKLIIEKLDGMKEIPAELSRELKISLLEIPILDTRIGGKRSPLMNAVSLTTNSLYRCFAGESRKLLYPEVVDGAV